jgi:hypothetical protein
MHDVRTTLPVPVTFTGMPNTRWWSFEERKTNYGDVDASTTDLAKLMFLEFALVYANDWFIIPYTLPAGAIAAIRALVVTNVFGERFSIDAAGSSADAQWQRWSMFTIAVRGQPGAAADTSLLLLPTAAKILESPPFEDIMMIRDEVANMVWGVETTIPTATGESKRGIEAARQTRAFFEAQLAARLAGTSPAPPPNHAPVPARAPIRYQVMTSVPESWIPFIPVHVPGDNREIQLQRAAQRAPAPGPRPRAAAAVLRVRGGGAARGHAPLPGVRAHALERRPRPYLAAGAPPDRSRRRHERARLRQADRCAGERLIRARLSFASSSAI